MAQAKTGDTVRVHYTGRFNETEIFDTSEGREPLEFTIGEGNVIPGVEKAVIGMSPGEKKTANIACADAYGEWQEGLVIELGRDQLPPHIDPQPGQQLEYRQPDGRSIIFLVTNVGESSVTLDANHPLAGKDLVFDLELVEIV